MKYQNDDKVLNELKKEFQIIEAPNLSSQIKARYLMENNQRKRVRQFNLRTLYRPAMGLLAIFLLVLLIVISNNNITPPANITLDEKYHQEITFKSLSAINLLPVDNSLSPTNNLLDLKSTTEEIDDIHQYILLVEQALNANIVTLTQISDLKEYQYKDQITMTTPFGLKYEYLFYYNLTVVEIDKDEQEYEISGMIIFEGYQYHLSGKHEIEGDESETTFYANLDNDHWVKIKLEFEEDEETYQYEVYNNGNITKIELSVEKDDKETDVKLTIRDNKEKTQYKFQKVIEDNQTLIKIKTNGTNIKVYIIFDENDNPIYEYFLENSNQKIQKGPKVKNKQGPNKRMLNF